MSQPDLHVIADDIFKLANTLSETLFNRDEFFKIAPIPPSHFKVIFYLIHRGASSMSDIATHLCISKPNVTPIIDRLIAEGFVIRTEAPNDRRKLLINTTDTGKELFTHHKAYIQERLISRIESLSPEDLEEVHLLTERFIPIFDKIKQIK